jgi:SAM-dependent methyltransferase
MTRSRTDGAAGDWARALAGWAIPSEILAAAPEPPWTLPPELFDRAARPRPADDPSSDEARAALVPGGTVLDVGCGGGGAGLALVPPASRVVGVDESAAMLARFARAARSLGVDHSEVHGTWPDVEPLAGRADVVVCHHVAYNVPDIGPFLAALIRRATRRVVIEVTAHHPAADLSPLWERFWGLRRPDEPRADLLIEVLRQAGFAPRIERRRRPRSSPADHLGEAGYVSFVRRRLCLPAQRDPEVAEALAELPDEPSEIVTIAVDP